MRDPIDEAHSPPYNRYPRPETQIAESSRDDTAQSIITQQFVAYRKVNAFAADYIGAHK